MIILMLVSIIDVIPFIVALVLFTIVYCRVQNNFSELNCEKL